MSHPVETADSATTGRSEPAVAKTVPTYLRPAFLLTFFGVSLVLVLVLGLGNRIMNTPRGRFGGGIFSVALALHHYHDVFDTLPPGTVFAPGLSPEQRFSWAILIEPYCDWGQRPGKVEPRTHEGWNSPHNLRLDTYSVVQYRDPERDHERLGIFSGDLVGIAGLGGDAADLPEGHLRAGIFGYDRQTTFSSITDGLSNTMMLSTLNVSNRSIYAGGRDTVRGFSQRPYLNGPDGIGSVDRRGIPILLADASVRSLNSSVAPEVIEALATKAGGERVPEY